MPNTTLLVRFSLFLALVCLAACGDEENAMAPGGGEDDGSSAPSDPWAALLVDAPDLSACSALASDYSPGADDDWPECVSDGGTYVQVQESISTIGRVGGFETIADLLWRNGTPSNDAFFAARDAYATGEGLDSRVQRREDEHYPPVTDPETGETLRCRDEGVPAMDPDRCVGPARILPVLNEAFRAGIEGEELEANAARIEAALLWFLYVSSHKEGVSCATAAKDCDSAYAYYTGGQAQDGGIGLSGYVRRLSPGTHDAAWDGLLAVRCWRDIDDGEEAQDLELRDRAVSQYDRALLHGVAEIVVERLHRFRDAEGAERDAAWAFLEVLGPVLNRENAARDADAAATLAGAWSAGADAADADALIATLRGLYPCPIGETP